MVTLGWVTDDTKEVKVGVEGLPGVVKAKISTAISDPGTIDGKPCQNFTIEVVGTTHDTAVSRNVIWADIEGIEGTRGATPEPWGPGKEWTYSNALHVVNDITEDLNLTVRAGHVEGGKDVVDDTKIVTIKVTPSAGKCIVKGEVTGLLGMKVSGAIVTLDTKERTTDGEGIFKFTDMAVGSYKLKVEHWMYNPYEKELELTESGATYEITAKLSTKMLILGAGAFGIMGAVIGGASITAKPRERERPPPSYPPPYYPPVQYEPPYPYPPRREYR